VNPAKFLWKAAHQRSRSSPSFRLLRHLIGIISPDYEAFALYDREIVEKRTSGVLIDRNEGSLRVARLRRSDHLAGL
jgi:hypothetical protein